jgi:polar amino acid transport system substrate-binding protein
MTRRRFLSTSAALGVGALLGAPRGARTQGLDLAPAGPLRVAVDATNAALAAKDAASGEWQGVYPDLARALARRLGVPVAFVEYESIVERDAPAAAGAWDVASESRLEAAAARGWAAAVPYLDLDNTLVVGPDSAIRSVADMDRPGVRIGVLTGTAPEQNLSRLVQQAEVVRTATVAELVPLLRAGRVDALASNRSIVLAFAAQVPGARVLADRYAVTQQRLVLAPGRAAAGLALASAVTREALASGQIRAAIERSGVVGVHASPLPGPDALPRTGQTGPAPGRPAGVLGAALAVGVAGLLARPRQRWGPRA